MLTVVGIKNCNTVQKTLKWLDNEGHTYKFRDVKKNPLLDEELLDIVNKLSVETVINKKGTTWRKLDVSDKDLSDQELFELLLENQSMIKRPVLLLEGAVMIGFDEEAITEFLATE
jgi:Spx/MgsR family transcriptional regulator